MTVIVVLLGCATGLGAVLFANALYGRPLLDARPRIGGAPLSTRVEHLTARLALGVGTFVGIGAYTRWPVAAVLVGLAGFLAPGLVGGRGDRARQIARVEGIASWAEMLRDTLAGAGGLEQSIIASAGVAPLAIRAEVQALAARLERQRLAHALQLFADDLDDPTGDLVVAALLLAADKSPKRLGALLGMLADSARQEVTMRLRVDAGRARTRASVKVVTVATTVFIVFLVVLNRAYLEPYDEPLGQAMQVIIGACFATAYWWLARSARFQGQERFLTTTTAGVRT